MVGLLAVPLLDAVTHDEGVALTGGGRGDYAQDSADAVTGIEGLRALPEVVRLVQVEHRRQEVAGGGSGTGEESGVGVGAGVVELDGAHEHRVSRVDRELVGTDDV